MGGSYRYKTNALVIERFYGNEIDKGYAYKGLEFIDTLFAGAIVAINGGAIVLSDKNLDVDQKNILGKKKYKKIVEIYEWIFSYSINIL